MPERMDCATRAENRSAGSAVPRGGADFSARTAFVSGTVKGAVRLSLPHGYLRSGTEKKCGLSQMGVFQPRV